MMERVTCKLVEFQQPFELAGVDGVHPPGRYEVETTEEQINGLSFIAFRRLSTSMTFPASNLSALARQQLAIEPDDLVQALALDGLPDRRSLRCKPRSRFATM